MVARRDAFASPRAAERARARGCGCGPSRRRFPGASCLRGALLAIGVALVWPSLARAEGWELRGRVVDSATGEPVAQAEVVLRPPEGEVIGRVEAGGDGRFAIADLEAGGELFVIASAPGYQPSSALARPEEAELEIGLAADRGEVIDLEGEAPEEPDAPSQLELEREELETLPGSRGDALSALQSLPGVTPPSSSVSGGPPIIRGSAEDDSLILVDGVPVPIAFHFFALQSILPTAMIEGIDYIPGGFGVSEGRATGGVIRVRSRPTAESDTLEGAAEMSFLDVGGHVTGPLSEERNLSFAAGFRRSVVDALLPLALPDEEALSFSTAPQYYDGQLRVDWRPDPAHRVSVLALGSLDRLSLVNESENPTDPVATGQGLSSTDFSRAIASWEFRDGGLESRTASWVGATDVDVALGDDRFVRSVGWEMGARHDTRWRVHPRAALEVGGDVTRRDQTIDVKMPLPNPDGFVSLTNDPPLEGSFDVQKPLASAYVAAELSPTGRVSVTPGLRLDYYGYLEETVLQPRIQTSLLLGSRWTLRGAAGEYSRDLRRDDLLADFLSPERARQFVLGADYELSDRIELSASTYYTDLRDLVVRDFERAETHPLRAWENRGRGRTYGIETLASARGDSFYGWVSYTYARSFRRDGEDADLRPFEFDRPHNLIAVGSYELGPWRFGGQFRIASGQLTTPVEGSIYVADTNTYEPLPGQRNSERFRLAHQLDLRVDRRWEFDAWRLSTFLDVTNVYARPQVLGYAYNFDYTEREEITDIPILPSIGIRGSF